MNKSHKILELCNNSSTFGLNKKNKNNNIHKKKLKYLSNLYIKNAINNIIFCSIKIESI